MVGGIATILTILLPQFQKDLAHRLHCFSEGGGNRRYFQQEILWLHVIRVRRSYDSSWHRA
jgi:hypothetical protein